MRSKAFVIKGVWLLNAIIFTVDVGGMIGDRSVFLKISMILMTAVCAAYVMPRAFVLRKKMPHVNAMIVYFAFALLSSVWSSNSLMTIAFALHLLAIAGLSVYAAHARIDLIRPSCAAFGLVVFASYATLIVAPEYAIKLADGSPRFGGLTHPNTLASIALVVWVLVLFHTKRGNGKKLLLSVVAGVTIVLAQSRTTFAVFLMVITILLLDDAIRAYRSGRVSRTNVSTIYLPFGVVLAALVFGYQFNLLNLSGVRTGGIYNLTGRLEIWAYYLSDLQRSWLLGGGFGAYTRQTEIGMGAITGAHNSYIEALAALGVLGLFVYIVVFILVVKFFLFTVKKIYQRAYGYVLVMLFLVFSLLGTSLAGTFSWMHVLVLSLSSAAVSRQQIFAAQAMIVDYNLKKGC